MRFPRAIAGLLGMVILAGLALAADDPPERPRVPPQAVFLYGDADADGLLSRDEFRAIVARAPRLKGRGELIGPLFDRIDTNRDGSLTLEEFRDYMERSAPGAGQAKAKAAARPP